MLDSIIQFRMVRQIYPNSIKSPNENQKFFIFFFLFESYLSRKKW